MILISTVTSFFSMEIMNTIASLLFFISMMGNTSEISSTWGILLFIWCQIESLNFLERIL